MSCRATLAAVCVAFLLLAGALGTAWDVYANLADRTTITLWLRLHGTGWAAAVGVFAGLLAGVSIGHLYGRQQGNLEAAAAAGLLALMCGILIGRTWLY